ncbi:MAG: type VI secretion system ATPase TssH, partial [Gemmatimonadetes bacterium]|nr:type VI secretion system ATPase TssH [Gemmatimonadota bacterium]
MINFERLTMKATEALRLAANDARGRGNPEVDGPHLLGALLEQEEGIVLPVLQKIGVQVDGVRARVQERIGRLAKVSGGADPTLSRELRAALEAAEKKARELGDEYVSTEHFLVGLASARGDARAILEEAGADEDTVLEALDTVRGSHRVTDQTPEDTYRALARYSRDLTDLARQGKLDPVIGR